MKVSYTHREAHDVDMAFAWYEDRSKGLGFEFLESIKKSIGFVLTYPKMYPVTFLNYRRCHAMIPILYL